MVVINTSQARTLRKQQERTREQATGDIQDLVLSLTEENESLRGEIVDLQEALLDNIENIENVEGE